MTTSGQDKKSVYENRYSLSNRYVFKGKLVMETALHIGGGRVTLSSSNSPIVLTPDQKPFIPGSSFKGALRSTVEKIVPNLPDFRTCALIEMKEEIISAAQKQGEFVCSTLRQAEFTKKRRDNPEDAEWLLEKALAERCDTCRLFGSPFAAARLNVNDLYIPQEEWSGVIQIRDGVAIDRDSEKAKDRLKYDFEVVPASATFSLEIVLENATPEDVQLVCVGLSEFVHGFGVIGGKRSRGLGVSRLEELTVRALEVGDGVEDATRKRRMREYLIKGQMDEIPGSEFLELHIGNIFA